MTSARIAQLLEISERRLVAMESSVSRLERRMDEHEERIEDLEEIFADIKLAAADQAVRLHPDGADMWWLKAAILAGLERYEESLAAADEAVRLDPNNADNWRHYWGRA